jgi:hypothetical protein
VLGHVNRVDLDPDPVLHRPGDTLGKWSNITLAPVILQNLSLPFGHEFANIKIDDLPGLVSGIPIIVTVLTLHNCKLNYQLRWCDPNRIYLSDEIYLLLDGLCTRVGLKRRYK